MIDILLILLILLLGLILILLIQLVGGIFSYSAGGPPVPTKQAMVKQMIAMADIKSGESVVDLGSGDGRLVFAAAKAGASAVGYEVSWPTYLESKLLQAIGGHSGRIIRANIFRASLRGTDVVFCYLLPQTMARLKTKLEKELAPGARVISHAWPVPGWLVVKKEGKVFLQYRP